MRLCVRTCADRLCVRMCADRLCFIRVQIGRLCVGRVQTGSVLQCVRMYADRLCFIRVQIGSASYVCRQALYHTCADRLCIIHVQISSVSGCAQSRVCVGMCAVEAWYQDVLTNCGGEEEHVFLLLVKARNMSPYLLLSSIW